MIQGPILFDGHEVEVLVDHSSADGRPLFRGGCITHRWSTGWVPDEQEARDGLFEHLTAAGVAR